MVVIEFRRPQRDESDQLVGSCLVTRLSVDGHDVRVEGDEQDLDYSQRVPNLRTGQPTTFDEDPEEWARGLIASYRTPYLWAEIVEDSNPLPALDLEPIHVQDPAEAKSAIVG